jgi:Acetyltransferase (GNAT) family
VSTLTTLRHGCGNAYTFLRDHVGGITRSIVFEASSSGIRGTEGPPTVAFRFGGAEDLRGFSEELYDYSERDKQFGLERLRAGDSLIVGAFGGSIVFYAWLMHEMWDLDQNVLLPAGPICAYSYRIYTVPDARGLRICSAYYSHVKDLLAQVGYQRLICRIGPRNEASIRAHIRVGFRPCGQLAKVVVPGATFYRADATLRAWLPTVAPGHFSYSGYYRNLHQEHPHVAT